MIEKQAKEVDKSKLAEVFTGEVENINANYLTLVKIFLKSAKENKDSGVRFYDRNGKTTYSSYGEIRDKAKKIVTGLLKNNIKPKEVVIFQFSSSRDYLETFWACMFAGIVPAPITIPKVFDTENLECKVVYNTWNMIGKVKIIVSDDIYEEYVSLCKKFGIDKKYVINAKDLKDNEPNEEVHDTKPEDPAIMFFTSGSTGMPKGVVQSNQAVIKRELGEIQLIKATKDVSLNWMPLEHAGGILMSHFRGVLLGDLQIQVETDYILEDPFRWLDLIDKYRVSYTWAPHFAYALIDEKLKREDIRRNWDLSCVRYFLDGGEMINAKSAKNFLKSLEKYKLKGNVIIPVWGMAETCSGTIYSLRFTSETFTGVQIINKSKGNIINKDEEFSMEGADIMTEIGVPIPGMTVRVTDRENNVLKEDEIGRVLIKGYPVTKSYYNNPKANAENFTEDGWFITGDLGMIHDGQLLLTGREKDVIIVNGLNYYNVEIETIIDELEEVETSYTAVCAVQNDTTKEDEIIVFFVCKDEFNKDSIADKIAKCVLEKMRLKVNYVIPVERDEIPKTNLGKIQRAKLGKRFKEGYFNNLLVKKIDKYNLEIEKIEESLKTNNKVNKMALLVEKIEEEIENINLSDVGIFKDEEKIKCLEENKWYEEVNEIVSNVYGVKDGLVENVLVQDNILNILFVSQVDDFRFSMLTSQDIKNAVNEKLDLNIDNIIPIDEKYFNDGDIKKLYEDGEFNEIIKKADLYFGNDKTLPNWFYKERLSECERSSNDTIDKPYLIFIDEDEYFNEISKKVADKKNIIKVSHGEKFENIAENKYCINQFSKEDYFNLFKDLSNKGINEVSVIHLWNLRNLDINSVDELKNAQYDGPISIQYLVQESNKNSIELSNITVATLKSLAIGLEEDVNYYNSTLSGYIKAAACEEISIKHVDLDDIDIGIVMDEANCADKINQIVYRNNKRYKIMLEKVDVRDCSENKIHFNENGFYAITGGLGGVAYEVVSHILTKYNLNILLIGRSDISNNEAKLEMLEKLNNISEGSKVKYVACNLTDMASLEETIKMFENEFNKKLSGVLHFAGIIQENLIKDQTPDDLFEMYNAKVFGTWVLGKICSKYDDCILVTSSSARTVSPGVTVSSYTSANEFMANYIQGLNKSNNSNNYCLAWSIWDEIGMSTDLVVKKFMEEKGFKAMKSLFGVNSLLAVLQTNIPYLFVGLDNTKAAIKKLLDSKVLDEYQVSVYIDYHDIVKDKDIVQKAIKAIENSSLKDMPIEVNYMLDIPLDKNNSVDKNVLLNRKNILRGKAEIVKPTTENEKSIFAIWEGIFNNSNFGIEDSFFELGGDSIKIIQLSSALKDKFNSKITYNNLFANNTIKLQAKLFENESVKVEENNVIETKEIEEAKTLGNSDLGDNVYALSSSQKRQWIMYELEPDSPYYNNTISITINGQVIVPCLKMAIYSLIDRHDSLRSKFNILDRTPYQVVDESIDINIEEFDLRDLSEGEREEKLKEIHYEEVNKVINITKEYPIRASIIYLNDSVQLLMSLHHIVSDGWSMRVLLQDLSSSYKDIIKYGRSKLPELNKNYFDFISLQEKFLVSDEFQEQLSYWKSEFDDEISNLDLPLDKKRPEEGSNLGKRLIFDINQEVTTKLKDLATEKGCTLYMLLMSAFSCMMQRYTLQNDIVLGTLIANRNDSDFEKMIGLFVNTLPIRINVESTMEFESLINGVKDKVLKMYDNQDVPFDVLIDELQIKREANKNPLFQVLFVVQNAQLESIQTSNLSWNLEIEDSETSKFDFLVQIFQINNKLSVKYEYDSDLFEDETIERWKEHFTLLLEEIVKDPNKKVGEYDFISQGERELVRNVNDTKTVYESELSLYEVFSKAKNNNADKIAIEFNDEKLTYEELDNEVNKFAAYLIDSGVGKGDVIALVAEKSIKLVTAMLAILKIGAAYVPINEKYPNDMVDYIVKDSNASLMICSNEYDKYNSIERLDINNVYSGNVDNVKVEATFDDTAYIMYTSGSTGKPKGVLVTNRNIIRLVNNTNFIEFKEDDVILQTGSLTFDASTFEVWGALLNGLKLHLVEEDKLLDVDLLRNEIRKSKASIMWVSSPLFNQLSQTDEKLFDGVRVLLVGGDVLSPKNINVVKNACKGITIINGYGPTENTTFSTTHKIEKEYKNSIPIGKPIANSTAYILNDFNRIQPIGTLGELCVGGDGIAKGYLNREDLSKERFIENPFSKGGVLYKTGDYAKLMKDGNIYFIGRMDNQVKVRGFRIELQAITEEINNIEGIENCVVCCKKEGSGDKKIIAYVIGRNKDDILDELNEKLPDYMIPHYIIEVDKIPLNKNGKVNFKLLPDISEYKEAKGSKKVKLPETEVEIMLYEIWREVLNIDEFGVNDNFFKLGGDSILVIQLTNNIKQKGYEVTTKTIFKNQTIEELALHIKKKEVITVINEKVSGSSELIPIQKWFFEDEHEEINFWNLPAVIHFEENHSCEVIEKAVNFVIEYHDSLNSRFVNNEGEYLQSFDNEEYKVTLKQISMDTEDKAKIEEACEACEKEIDIEKGRLLQGVLFNIGNEQRLYISVHHLVVDGVSWRIIHEDILSAIKAIENNEEISLMNKTTSYKEWSNSLKKYAVSNKLLDEYSYWNDVNSNIDNIFNLKDVVNSEENSITIEKVLDKNNTSLLLKTAGNKLNTEINDLLLAALYKTFKTEFNIDKVAITLEGHGREDIIDYVDISRTVGWFTTAFPIVLESGSEDIDDIVLDVKEILRNIPKKGIGYGILKYTTKEIDGQSIEFNNTPDIAFNYLGDFDDELEIGSREYGKFHSESSKRDNLIEFNIVLVHGELKIYMTYLKNLEENINEINLLDKYKDNLLKVIEYCSNMKEVKYSESDFPLINLDRNEINKIFEENNNVSDIYALAPVQKGMLYHYMVNSESEAYFGQICCDLNGVLNKKVFEEAWLVVINNNKILSTIYKWEEIKEPVQIVINNMDFKVNYIDMPLGENEEEYINKLLDEDKSKVFDLTKAPLLRVKVVSTGLDKNKLIVSFPHISLDGWSVFVILSEVIKAYKQILQNGDAERILNKGIYKDYINWIYQKDEGEDKLFWKNYLEGFKNDNTIWGTMNEELYDEEEEEFIQDLCVFSKEETEEINKFVKESGRTLNTIMQGALALTLKEFADTEDVVFGMTTSGRNPEIENVDSICGLLINTLPVRVKIDNEAKVDEFLEKIQLNAFEIKNYETTLLTDIKEVSKVKNSEDLFKVILVFENYPVDEDIYNNSQLYLGEFRSHERTNYDLTIVVLPEGDLKIRFSYVNKTFNRDILQMLEHYLKLIVMQLVRNSGNLSELSLMNDELRETILNKWSTNFKIDTMYEDQDELYGVIALDENEGEIYLLDENHELVLPGFPGEVYVSIKDINNIDSEWNDYLMENSIESPFSKHENKVLYKTGDIGFWNKDGEIKLIEL